MKKIVSSLVVAVVALAGCHKKEKSVETSIDDKDKSQKTMTEETKQVSDTPVVEKHVEREDSSSAYVAPIGSDSLAPSVNLVNVIRDEVRANNSNKEEPKLEQTKVEQPKVEQPKVEEPKVEEPKVEQSKVEQPKVEQHKVEQPKVEQPKVEQPKVEQPKVEQPKVEQPKVEQPKVEQPKVEQPKVEQPKVEQPKVAEPKVEQPKVEQPKVEQPKVEQPKVEQPKVEQPKVEQPKVEQPKVEQPKVEQPKVEQPKVEQPKVEEPKVEQPKVEEPKVEQPKVEHPKVVQPKVEQPKVEEPKVEQPKVEQPKVEQPKVEQPKYKAPIGGNLVEPEIHVNPEYKAPIGGNLVEPEIHVKPEYKAPIGGNLVESEIHVKSEYKAPIGGNLGEPEIHVKPEYKAPIGGNLVEPEIYVKPTIELSEQPKFKVNYEMGSPLIQQDLPVFEFSKMVTKKNTPIIPPYVMLAHMFMKEGETKVDFPGKEGLKEEEIEEIKDKEGNILAKKLLKTTETKPIVKVTRFGTMTPTSDLGNTGLYNIREHFPNADFVQFNHAIKLTGDELKQLSSEERYKRANGKDENSLWLAGDPGHYIIANAPLSDDTVDKMNNGNYIDHKLVGKEMLKLVNEERVRVGKKELKWSDNLYEFAKIRAHELGENGHIRFYNNDNKAMPHTRDKSGKSWDTVFEGTKFYGRGYGENTAGYTMPRNIYQAFSEKTIAERLFNQWKGSKGHYANMIHDGYGYFAFDMNASKFWRNDKDSLDYLAQGIQGVQMFGGLNFEDKN